MDQLTAPTVDGGGKENGGAQCVAAALAAAVVGVTGLTCEPDELKDAATVVSGMKATARARRPRALVGRRVSGLRVSAAITVTGNRSP